MASINATSSSTTSRLTAKTGIGGLVSGMDIDELVENLTARSREKITKQQQLVQKLEWKQTAYRSVTKALNEFQSKYLDMLSATNFRSKSFFNTVKAFSSSDAVTVVGTGSAATAGSITINSIAQLATNQTIESGAAVSRPLTTSNTVDQIITALRADGGGDGEEAKAIGLQLDGKFKTITFDAAFWDEVDGGTGNQEENFKAALQSRINSAFGSGSGLKVEIGADQRLTFLAPGSKISVVSVDAGTSREDFGFAIDQSNKINLYSSLLGAGLTTTPEESAEGGYQVTINGEKFEFKQNDSLKSIIDKINASKAGVTISYSSITDKFTMTSKTSGEGDNIVIQDTGGKLMEALGLSKDKAKEVVTGQNAILSVNGQTITRSSNTFEIDGAKVTLNKEVDAVDGPITLTLKEDASGLEDAIRKFVDDYNAMIGLMTGLTKEKVYKDFPPLTDAQKAEMTETQIATWEGKAKSGILRGDSLLGDIATKLQSTIAGLSVDGFSLYSMGISTSSYVTGGKLQINETKFKQALETKGSEIRELFSSEKGLGNTLNTVITDATKTSGTKGNRGTLVEAAGVEDTRSDTENSIYDQIKRANKNITTLQDRLKAEEARYWSKFSYMESMINNLNAQGAMLSSFTNS